MSNTLHLEISAKQSVAMCPCGLSKLRCEKCLLHLPQTEALLRWSQFYYLFITCQDRTHPGSSPKSQDYTYYFVRRVCAKSNLGHLACALQCNTARHFQRGLRFLAPTFTFSYFQESNIQKGTVLRFYLFVNWCCSTWPSIPSVACTLVNTLF